MNSTINQQAMGLQVFYNEEVNVNIRTKDVNGVSWFVAKDICDALGLVNSRKATASLDNDERGASPVVTPSGVQEMTVVNESGLYGLIFQSRKPEARAFRKWVTNVVLTSIRRTGSYSSTGVQTPIEEPSKKLPLPKYRPFFENWQGCVSQHLAEEECHQVASFLGVSYSHVRKVYLGTAVSESVARMLTQVAMLNKRRGVRYEKLKPVYEQLSIEWEKEEVVTL